jgi:hypothetical protein
MSNRKNRSRALAGAVTTALALAGAGYGTASAAADPPALTFVAATRDVVAERYVDEEYTWFDLDLGVNLVAGMHPFEIRASRKSYAQPIVAQQIVVGADGKKTSKVLPDGLFTDFGGFEDFTKITIKDGEDCGARRAR